MGFVRTRRPIWGYSVCLENFHRKNKYNLKITPDAPKDESGLTQIIMMGKWVNGGLISLIINLVVRS